MLRIECPFCGPRTEDEFLCGGQSHIARPAEPASVSDQEWSAYLYERENPRGVHYERWCHRFGCGQWFNVARDLVSHELRAVYRMTDPRPELDGDRS